MGDNEVPAPGNLRSEPANGVVKKIVAPGKGGGLKNPCSPNGLLSPNCLDDKACCPLLNCFNFVTEIRRCLMENLLRQGDDNRPLVRSYPKCRLLLKRTIYLGELVDVSLKGALFAPEHVIENSHNKACRLYLEGIEPAINGIVIQEGILLCIKFLGVRHAEQKTIEMIARDDAPEFAQKIERDMSDLMRRRSGLIQMTMH